jgi:hypothetical protein
MYHLRNLKKLTELRLAFYKWSSEKSSRNQQKRSEGKNYKSERKRGRLRKKKKQEKRTEENWYRKGKYHLEM